MKDIERVIEQVDGSMSMEGMPLTSNDKDRIRRCAGDDRKVDKEIAELIKKHSAVQVPVYEPRL
jgi:hypothetical protein